MRNNANVSAMETSSSRSSVDTSNVTLVSPSALPCSTPSLDLFTNMNGSLLKQQKRLGSKKAAKPPAIISSKVKRNSNSRKIKNSGKSKYFPIFNQPKSDPSSDTNASESVVSQSSPETQNDRSFSEVLRDALADSQSGTSDNSDSEDDEGRGARHEAMDHCPVDPNPRGQSPSGSDHGRPVDLNPRDQSPGGSGDPSHAAPAGTEDPQSELDYLRGANSALLNQLSETESELLESKKLCKRQKLSIKKLKSKIDELQKSISGHVGVKKMLKKKSVGVSADFDVPSYTSELEDILSKTQSELDLAHAKHESLKTQIQVHTSNMFSALADEDTVTDTPPASIPTAEPRQKAKRSRGEPVKVDIKFSDSSSKINFQSSASPSASNPLPSYWNAESYKEVPNPTKAVVGSSLARGTSEALKHCGVNVSEYYFSGKQIPFIYEHVKRILENNPQIEQVVLILGGNDCESDLYYLEDIMYNYDALIDMIKLTLGSDSTIIISSIPQRRWCSTRSHIRIAKLNEMNSKRENGAYGVYYVDAAPRFQNQFYDRVHMNNIGLDHWAACITDKMISISNFHQKDCTTRL